MPTFLRRNASGCFDGLLHAVSNDPATLLYFDGAKRREDKPGENFIREVTEPFTIGESHTVTKLRCEFVSDVSDVSDTPDDEARRPVAQALRTSGYGMRMQHAVLLFEPFDAIMAGSSPRVYLEALLMDPVSPLK